MLAPGAGLSAWVRLLCLKCCEAEAAPSLPLMVPALLPPAWTHWLASTEQGGPAIMSQQGQGWGQATKGTMLPPGGLPCPSSVPCAVGGLAGAREQAWLLGQGICAITRLLSVLKAACGATAGTHRLSHEGNTCGVPLGPAFASGLLQITFSL